jgi:RimJ/RimL family protein N-acetyltransferase
VRLAADWAFSDLGVSEILLEIEPGNLASVRVAHKCGFEPAQVQSEPGSSEKLVFAINKNE